MQTVENTWYKDSNGVKRVGNLDRKIACTVSVQDSDLGIKYEYQFPKEY